MCENAKLSIKNPKASRALKQALDPGRRMLISLARLRFAMSATFGLRSWGPPLTKSWIRTWLACFIFWQLFGRKNTRKAALFPSSANGGLGTSCHLQRYCVFENEHIDFSIECISVVNTLVTSCHAPFCLRRALVCFYRGNTTPPGTCV